MGIHNEEGFQRLQTDLRGLVHEMLLQLLDEKDTDRSYVKINSSDTTVLLINNLGGVSALEMGYITDEVCSQLHSTYAINPIRTLAGTYMSSLNGLGFSISILKTPDVRLQSGETMIDLLDATAEAIGWPATVRPDSWKISASERQSSRKTIESNTRSSGLRCKYFNQALCLSHILTFV